MLQTAPVPPDDSSTQKNSYPSTAGVTSRPLSSHRYHTHIQQPLSTRLTIHRAASKCKAVACSLPSNIRFTQQHTSSLQVRSWQQHPSWRTACRASSSGGPPAAAEAAEAEEESESIEPFTEEELQALSELESEIDVDALGEAWRQQFVTDIDGLYDYVDRWVLLDCACAYDSSSGRVGWRGCKSTPAPQQY